MEEHVLTPAAAEAKKKKWAEKRRKPYRCYLLWPLPEFSFLQQTGHFSINSWCWLKIYIMNSTIDFDKPINEGSWAAIEHEVIRVTNGQSFQDCKSALERTDDTVAMRLQLFSHYCVVIGEERWLCRLKCRVDLVDLNFVAFCWYG